MSGAIDRSAMEAVVRAHCRTLKIPTLAREFVEVERRAIHEEWSPLAVPAGVPLAVPVGVPLVVPMRVP